MRNLLKTMYIPDTETVTKTTVMVGISIIIITGFMLGADTLIMSVYQTILNIV